jgi:hypothetical protein
MFCFHAPFDRVFTAFFTCLKMINVIIDESLRQEVSGMNNEVAETSAARTESAETMRQIRCGAS